jgi:hypothetical protein
VVAAEISQVPAKKVSRLLACVESQEFSERFADCENFSEVSGSEIGADFGYVRAFAADLDHADDFISGKNGCADDFLDGLGGFGAGFYAFEDASVTGRGEIVVDFRAALASGAGGKRGIAGERDEADVFEGVGNNEVQMAPTCGNAEDSHFVDFHAETLRDTFSDGGPGDGRTFFGVVAQSFGEAFEFSGEAQAHDRIQEFRSVIATGSTTREGFPAGSCVRGKDSNFYCAAIVKNSVC